MIPTPVKAVLVKSWQSIQGFNLDCMKINLHSDAQMAKYCQPSQYVSIRLVDYFTMQPLVKARVPCK